MAVRRNRTRTPPRKAAGGAGSRSLISWLVVLVAAAGLGWIWWRAAYGPSDRNAGGGARSESRAQAHSKSKWDGWWDRWQGTVEEEEIEDLPPIIREELNRMAAAKASAGAPPEKPVVLAQPPAEVPSPSPSTRTPGNDIAPDALETPGSTGVVARVETSAPTPEEPDEAANALAARREGTSVLAVQVALARRGISSGPIDGVAGSQTRAALRAFQRTEGLPVTGLIDERTLARLPLGPAAMTNYVLSQADFSRLTWVPSTWVGKSTRERLDYESILELVAERSHSHPQLIRQLNPNINWYRVRPGVSVTVPAAVLPAVRGRIAFVRISLSEKALRAFDSASNLVAHFPCSIAKKAEKRPVGRLEVVRLAPNPNYRFDPEIFKDSPEARTIGRKLMIPPGPNNPVGTAWIGLSRPGYGIHGTPNPEAVGRTESHGCFRLANWNAEFLVRAAWVGMPVHVEP
ncbi:MAG: peptidoglycan-binding protein [Limisphaerales bacterium]